MIEWNDGLNIGVKSIDDDHKKLLRIVNDFFIALEQDSSQDVFEKIFVNLEKSVISHCNQEEVLLKQCSYEKLDEHKKQHEVFIDSIIELRENFYFENGYIDINEMTILLTKWLMTHIIDEDMLLFDTFKKCGLIKNEQSKSSWFNKLIKETTITFTFTKRILISAFIPLIGMLILSFIIILNDYDKYKKVANISNITYAIVDLNELTHALQIERGLSSGHISSNNKKFYDKLLSQRKVVDKIKNKFINGLEEVDLVNNKFIIESLALLKSDSVILQNVRKQIDTKTISKIKEIDFFTKMIDKILFITSRIMFINTNKDISHSLSILSSMLNVKELMGQERARGTIIIEQKFSSKDEYEKFIELLGAKKTHLAMLDKTLALNDEIIMDSLLLSPIANNVFEYERKILDSDYKNLDSKIWFQSMTKYIDSLKLFTDSHIIKTNILIRNNVDTAVNNLRIWFLYTFSILFVTIFIIYLFEKSTKVQISKLIKGMKHLALGGRTLRLESENSKDEMYQIFEAYEITRQKLLEGDIYTELYLSQEKLKSGYQKRINIKLEQEVMHDGLTGLFNRKYYTEVIEKELFRAKRDKLNFTFVMMDIDFFKLYNDTYGHYEGDLALKELSNVLKEKLNRASDFCFRLGGEEFGFFFTGSTLGESISYTEEICQDIEKLKISHSANKASAYITASFGLVNVNMGTTVINEHNIYVAADNALYQAKESGRNCVMVFENKNIGHNI